MLATFPHEEGHLVTLICGSDNDLHHSYLTTFYMNVIKWFSR